MEKIDLIVTRHPGLLSGTKKQNGGGIMKTAQEIKLKCKNSAEAMEMAGKLVDGDQDWDNEKTTYTFEDGSQLVCSGPDFWVTER